MCQPLFQNLGLIINLVPQSCYNSEMKPSSDYVEYYLEMLRDGDFETAFHSFIDLDCTVIPKLIEKFQSESSSEVRAELVRIIWYFRSPDSTPFLGTALKDPSPDVWKSAIDGLVSIGTPAALAELQKSLTIKSRGDEFTRWIEEAITQIKV
jgi:HEAT repeat protein